MSLLVTFRHAARDEFIEAAAWYEVRHPNLGVEFIAEIDRCVALAAECQRLSGNAVFWLLGRGRG